MNSLAEEKTRDLFPGIMQRAAWWIVVFLLFFIPFQLLVQVSLSLPRHYLWIDELVVLVAFAVFLITLARRGRCRKGVLAIFGFLLFLVVLAAASAFYNRNPFTPSFGGAFNLIKCLLPIPVFSLWAFGKRRVGSLYLILHRLSLFLCLVAIFQEVAFFAGWPMKWLGVEIVDDRFFFMRAPSLLYHANAFGLYSLLFFLLDFSLHRRFRWQNLLLLLGVLLSSSRVAWAGLFLGFYYLLAAKNRKLVVIFMPVLIFLLAALLPYFEVWNKTELASQKYYRRYVILKSIEIWKDHPFIGVGPGMFGGWVNPAFISLVFTEYNFDPVWLENLQKHRTLDCFWAQHLAENGLTGVVAFAILLWLLWRVAWREAERARDPFRKKLLIGISAVPLVMAIYLSANVLNMTPFLITYSVLFGLLLGQEEDNGGGAAEPKKK